MSNYETPAPLSSVTRAIQIVEHFSEHGELGVTELANALDLHKSTAHAYLQTLEQNGYLINTDGRYRLSLEFMRIAGVARNDIPVYREGRSEVRRLANEIGELVNIGVEEQGFIYVISMAEGEQAVHDGAPEGKRAYMHCTAMGKIMLAYLSEPEVRNILSKLGMPEMTEYTITDPDEFIQVLSTVREQGYAIDAEENNIGIRCIAAPITDGDHQALGAISVTGPAERMKRADRQQEIIEKVTSVANVIEVRLEYP